MPNGLRKQPLWWVGSSFDGIQTEDLGSTLVLPNSSIAIASIGPGKLGKTVINKTGSAIAAGSLVFVNGYDATTGLATINLAAAQFQAEAAVYVAQVAIPNNGTGQVGVSMTLTGQNTNAGNVGDAVFLSATTPGAYTLALPALRNAIVQIVGHITVKSVSAGTVALELWEGRVPALIGANELQPGSVGAAALSVNMARSERHVSFTVPTTASVEVGVTMEHAGTITGLQVNCNTALAINGTNYVTWAVNNRTASLLLTQAVVADSTNTGGTAVVQYAATPLVLTATGGNLVVAANDYVTLLATVTGTLGAVLTGTFSVVVAPS